MISPKDGDTLLQAVQVVAAAVGASAGMPAAASVDGALPPPPMAPLPAVPSAAVVSSSEGRDEREQGARGGGPPIPIPMEGGGGGTELWVQALAVDHQTSCAVCLQELIAEEMAVKLPCNHLFHQDCVRTWLQKQHTCPTCRGPLPQKGAPTSEDAPPETAEGLREWMEALAAPRGTAPMPSSAMYT